MDAGPGPQRTSRAAGTLVIVVGPSGAGKDTLISRAMDHYAGREDVHLVTRFITRPEDAGGEAHRAVSEPEFLEMCEAGAFAVNWQAHGLHYGVPANVHERLALGHLVIANGSRSVLSSFAKAFSPMLVVNVVATPEVLAQRLESRGRESREDILRRLNRSTLEVRGDFDVVTIDNSGVLDDAARELIKVLDGLSVSE